RGSTIRPWKSRTFAAKHPIARSRFNGGNVSKTPASSVLLAALTLMLSLSGCSKQADQASAPAGQPTGSADVRPPRNPLRNAYFGDLHLHSGFSMDAFAMG